MCCGVVGGRWRRELVTLSYQLRNAKKSAPPGFGWGAFVCRSVEEWFDRQSQSGGSLQVHGAS